MGTNISLQFTFNVSLTKSSYFGVYVTDQKKIAEYILGKYTDVFDIYPENSSVVWHIKNLKLNDSGSYWATIIESGLAQESNKVQLMVQEGNKSSTGTDGLRFEKIHRYKSILKEDTVSVCEVCSIRTLTFQYRKDIQLLL